MMFLHQKNCKKHCMLLKTTFEIFILLIEEDHEQKTGFDYYKYDVHISHRIN